MWNYFRSSTNSNGHVPPQQEPNVVNSNIDTNYDGYQQAWRILGIYVDCSINGCQRYLVWAAYIDLQYEGGSISEYQYYNPTTRTYDNSTCTSTTGTSTSRCVPMDCHEIGSSSTWSLMGIYKEPYYSSQFLEQLYKHMGYCLWDSTTYTFMETYYDAFPQQCVASTTVMNTNTNQPYYVDLKPGPNLTLALYTDPMCYYEYDANKLNHIDIDIIVQSAGYLSSNQLQQFNDAMMIFHTCQPCRTYNLNNADGLLYNNNGDNNNNNNNNANDPNYPKYSCLDIAGYINVNQCMKFRTHTQMISMSPSDIHIATLQGTITNLQLYQHSNKATTTMTTLSSSYHSIYFQSKMNEHDPYAMTMMGSYTLLSAAVLLMMTTIYYNYKVVRWMIHKRRTTTGSHHHSSMLTPSMK